MVWLGLLSLIVALLLLRQSLVLVLAVATAYVHVFVANSKIEFLIQDFWFTVDREVLLSVPLFMLAGNVMSRGSIARRLIELHVGLHLADPRRAGGGLRAVVRGLRGDQRLVDRHHARHRHDHVSGADGARLLAEFFHRRHRLGRHAGHHHSAVDPADPVRHHDRGEHRAPVRGRHRPGAAADDDVRRLFVLGQPPHRAHALQHGDGGAGHLRRHLRHRAALHHDRRHLHRLVQPHRGRRGVAGLCAADRVLRARGRRRQAGAGRRELRPARAPLPGDARDEPAHA